MDKIFKDNNSLINANLKSKQITFLIVAAIISLLLLMVPQLDFIARIFNIFTTITHETGHAIANLLSGNTNISIQVDFLTTGGVTVSYGIRNIFIISAGYLGASLLGGLLLISSASPKSSNIILRILGGFLILVAMFFTLGQWMTFAVTMLFSAVFIAISFIKNKRVTFFFVNLLAIQLIVNAFTDIITLIRISLGTPSTGGESDALHMAQLTFGNEFMWAVVYLLISIFIFIIAFRINRKLLN